MATGNYDGIQLRMKQFHLIVGLYGGDVKKTRYIVNTTRYIVQGMQIEKLGSIRNLSKPLVMDRLPALQSNSQSYSAHENAARIQNYTIINTRHLAPISL
jgi:hypothetical protein